MSLIRDVPLVLADASPFCRFAECGALESLITYLGNCLAIVRDVERELRHRARDPKHAELRQRQDDEPPFGVREVIDLDPGGVRNVQIIAERWQARATRRGQPRRHEKANYGEIATVLAAAERDLPVLIDEGKGKEFARARGLTSHTTEDLIAEMVVTEALSRRRGRLIYQRVYGGGAQAFASALAAVSWR